VNCPPRVSRRLLMGGAVVAAAALALPGLRAQSRLETTKISLAVEGRAALCHLPLTIAEQLGYFREEGLEVWISDFDSQAAAVRAVTQGEAEVCAGLFENTIYLQAQNQLFQSLVLQGRAPQMVLGVSSRSVPRYQAMADLKGRKIGVPALGSSAHMMASLALLKGGLAAHEMCFVGVGAAPDALHALCSGQVDALSHTDPVMTLLEQHGEIRIISDTRTLKGAAQVFGGAMPAACLYAPLAFIQKNPNTCQALVNAMVHGLKWLQTAGPGDIINCVPERYRLGDSGLYLASFNKVREAISHDGLMPGDGPATALRALARFDASIQPGKIVLASTSTNVFACRAKARFKA